MSKLTHTTIHEGWTKYDKKTKIEDLKQEILDRVAKDKFMTIAVGTDSKFKALSNKSKKRKHEPKEWSCIYISCISFAINGGGKGSGLIAREEQIFGTDKLTLFTRLWREVEMSVDLAKWIFDNTGIVPEVHFDVNPDEKWDSNQLFSAAVGYAKEAGFEAKCKPESACASKGADHLIKVHPELQAKKRHRKGKRKQIEIEL